MDNAWWRAYYIRVMDSTEFLNDIALRLDDGGSCNLWPNEAPPLPPIPSSPKAIYFQTDGEADGGVYGSEVCK